MGISKKFKKISWMFQVTLRSVSRVIKGISREFQGYFKEIKEVSGVFKECFKEI